jgi:hypothetical protein
MKNLLSTGLGTVSLWASSTASAQSGQTGTMMNGGMWDGGWMGGYGAYWVPILLVVVVGLVAWIVMRGRK